MELEAVGSYQGRIPQIKQPVLFGEVLPILDEETGYRGPIASKAAGVICRQFDCWARIGLVEPMVRSARGSGSQRLYSFRGILLLKVVKRLLDTGVSLQQVRVTVAILSSMDVDDLALVILMSDGASVYACTSADKVIDLMQDGQGVFGIVVGRMWRGIEGTLAELPTENLHDANNPEIIDKLARRRATHHASQFRDGVGLGFDLFPIHEVLVEVLVYSKMT